VRLKQGDPSPREVHRLARASTPLPRTEFEEGDPTPRTSGRIRSGEPARCVVASGQTLDEAGPTKSAASDGGGRRHVQAEAAISQHGSVERVPANSAPVAVSRWQARLLGIGRSALAGGRLPAKQVVLDEGYGSFGLPLARAGVPGGRPDAARSLATALRLPGWADSIHHGTSTAAGGRRA